MKNNIIIKQLLPDNSLSFINQIYTDNYYIFLWLENGQSYLYIDFEEYDLEPGQLVCILPQQAHYIVSQKEIYGWLLAIDGSLLSDISHEELNDMIFIDNSVNTNTTKLSFLTDQLYKQLEENKDAKNLADSLIDTIVKSYEEKHASIMGSYESSLTTRFKWLVSSLHRKMKQPSQYASILGISTEVLENAIRETTQQSADHWIAYQTVTEAKRLLYYTQDSIEQIAMQMGYKDPNVFIAIFTNKAGTSPSEFRQQYCE